MKNGEIYKHVSSGKLYLVNDYRLDQGQTPVRVFVICQRDGKDFGPIRSIDRAALIGPVK